MTIANLKKIRAKYFFENYIYAKFRQNRWYALWYGETLKLIISFRLVDTWLFCNLEIVLNPSSFARNCRAFIYLLNKTPTVTHRSIQLAVVSSGNLKTRTLGETVAQRTTNYDRIKKLGGSATLRNPNPRRNINPKETTLGKWTALNGGSLS